MNYSPNLCQPLAIHLVPGHFFMKGNSKYLIGANLRLYHSNSAVCHDQSNDGFEVDCYFEQFPDW